MGSSRHTCVSVVWRLCWAAELSQRRLQARNAGLQVLDLLFLVLARPVDLWQRHDGALYPLHLQPDVGGRGGYMLDLEGAICDG